MNNNKEKENEVLKEIQPHNENVFIDLDNEESIDNNNPKKYFKNKNEKKIQFDFSLDSQKDENNIEEKQIDIFNNNKNNNNIFNIKNEIEEEINNKDYINFSDKYYKNENVSNNNYNNKYLSNEKLTNNIENYNTLDEPVFHTLLSIYLFYLF